MTPTRLRSGIRKYGDAGRLMVAAYFAGCWLWKKRLYVTPTMLLLLCVSVALLRPHHKPNVLLGLPPIPAVAAVPVPTAPEPEEKSEYEKDKLEHTLIVHEGRDTWRVEIWWPKEGLEVGAYVKFYKNGRLVRRTYARELGADGFEFGKADFKTRFPLIVLQGIPGAGHLRDTTFYTIRHGRLIQMGRVGGDNHGPIFRDYDGDGKPEWVFDDYKWYDYFTKGPGYFLVYKQLKNGKLKLWKRLPNPKHQELPEHLGRNMLGA